MRATRARVHVYFSQTRCMACGHEPLALRVPWWLPLLNAWRRVRGEQPYIFVVRGRCPSCHTYARVGGLASSTSAIHVTPSSL